MAVSRASSWSDLSKVGPSRLDLQGGGGGKQHQAHCSLKRSDGKARRRIIDHDRISSALMEKEDDDRMISRALMVG